MDKLFTIPEGQPLFISGYFYVKADGAIEDEEVVFDRRDRKCKRVMTSSIHTDLIVLYKNDNEMEAVDRELLYKLQFVDIRNN